MKCGTLLVFIGLALATAVAQTTQPARPPTRPSTRELLARRLPEIRFDDAPLSDALEQLAELLGVTITPLWAQLEPAGIEPTTPITFRGRNLRAQTVLWLLLREAAGDGPTLAFAATGNLILISTAEYFDTQTVLRIYDVADLVAPQIRWPTFTIEQTSTYVDSFEPVVGRGAALVRPLTRELRAGTLFQSFREVDDDFSDQGRQRRMTALIELLTNTIAPESWTDRGGPGVIWPYGTLLFVRHSLAIHEQLGGTADGPPAP